MMALANKISIYLVSIKAATEEKREVVAYGLFHLMSGATQIAVLIISGMVFGNLPQIVVFTLFFTSLKCYVGGAHATKHWVCLTGFTVLSQAVCHLCKLIPSYISIPASAIVLLLVIWKAPVVHPNNPKPERKRRLFRKIALLIAVVQLITVAACCLLWSSLTAIILPGALGGLSAAVTLILPIPGPKGGNQV